MTGIISLSIKKCYVDLYQVLQKYKPENQSMSAFIFGILKTYAESRESGDVNFWQGKAQWNDLLKNSSPEFYGKFLEKMGELMVLEKVITKNRLLVQRI